MRTYGLLRVHQKARRNLNRVGAGRPAFANKAAANDVNKEKDEES